jgi:hypothetical protein
MIDDDRREVISTAPIGGASFPPAGRARQPADVGFGERER